MKKKAIITVKSNASMDDNKLIEVISPGEFYIEDDGFRVEYDETEISGMEGTKTIIFIRNNSFTLERKGSTTTKMDFKKRMKSTSLYKTPYGILKLNVDTKNLDINMSEKGGTIDVKYSMGMEGQIAMNTNLVVDIKVNDK
ncbi:DUF1934 domain-containing protein [Clostridium botulinum]|uniref:DUF1934 domain-containing protein n=1 Tax=Clostridium TaxID=1485 RepID=UPI000500D7E2|nr:MULTISPECIES: DUF1934 domain-containing protein [unclassified Clostridium]AIY80990.1 hypothetical protein U728_2973 [Clostridium botulinum 202F]KAI3344752.1 DUF1934 domain-containing protein [Clostridium botulinum]KFX54377.1 hypothetical protein KU40_16590 [Clostridium botulinum]KFX58484.1 hypothetical protein KU41_04495 [Clostridium botulinum]KON13250.1 hypothetical protein ACP50_15255 [Clostridium botulinum]